MQAAQYSDFSQDIASVQLTSVEKPAPSPGYVVVKVHAAAINPIDGMVMKGFLKDVWGMKFPFTMGYDFAGVVEAVDAADAGKPFATGDEVYAVNWGAHKHDDEGQPIAGAFAEFIRIPISKLSRKPAGVSFEQAAALALVGTTAWQVLFDCLQVNEGSKLLILGGPSAVGILAIQLAKAKGAFVATTCSTRNLDFIKPFGADRVINYQEEQWHDAADLKGFDAVMDVVGEQGALENARDKGVLKADGRFVSISNGAVGYNPAGHPPLQFASFFCLKNDPAVQDELAKRLAEGALQLPIHRCLPFTQDGLHETLQLMDTKGAQGKIVFTMV